MGLKIITEKGPVTVYANERTTQNGGKFMSYSIGVASKDKDGNWINGYQECAFKKDAVVNNKMKINISNSFFTVYKDREGKPHNRLFIMEFDVVEQGEAPQQNGQGFSGEDFMNIPDNISEELPFQ